MEYPNLPERKLIDIPANSRASRGTCKIITTRWSETKPSKLAKLLTCLQKLFSVKDDHHLYKSFSMCSIDGSTRKTCPIRAYNSTTPLKTRAERCREHKQLRKINPSSISGFARNTFNISISMDYRVNISIHLAFSYFKNYK